MYSELVKLSIVTVGTAAVAAGVLYFAWRYRQRVRETVSKWLKKNNLESSTLMSALIQFDKITVGIERIRRSILVETSSTAMQAISEEEISVDELQQQNPDVYQLLMEEDSTQQNILELVT